MAWTNITTNLNWEYDTTPPDPGGAQTALWETSTRGIRVAPSGDEVYVNCRHKLLHPAQDSIPNEISKTFWDHQAPTIYIGDGALIDVVYSSTSPNSGSIDSIITDSWSNGLPSDSNPGLFDGGTAPTATGFDVWYGVVVRQTGGTLVDTALAMRGGAEDGSSFECLLEIDDIANTGSYKNLDISGQLTLWKQFGTGNTLSVLNGYADVGTLACTSPADITVNILNGRLDVGYFVNARVTVNMLTGGTGEFILDDMYGTAEAKSKLDQMILNFESGSVASFTIVSNNGVSAVGEWEILIAAGRVEIDGVTETNVGAFTITNTGDFGTTIKLA